ncbi:hypothetical protein DL762_009511 [Monosporascus cannonballus]|uniref:MoaB/Mog domain-containing protein n=1 Tax=Monosporascus cannonballus TaxID=155416 RepID=A0ABY0GT51_9PEZI|nr:hypothetical protein DL762_009511 [Monosporascus cannonballus]
MASDTLKVALLIVSTTAARDPSSDASELALKEVLDKEGGGKWELVETKIVPDVVAQIQRQIILWADAAPEHISLILTTGGTGFATADNTPEAGKAVSALLHKSAPGLVHGMLAASLSVTPFAMMSRPVAGVRSKSVVITLPGSPKGAKENLQAVLKTLPHACLQAAGLDSRTLHAGGVKKLEADAGITPAGGGRSHSHHHHHDHGHKHGHGHGKLVRHTAPSSSPGPLSNDPALGPSRRNRESPYPMVSVEEALARIREHVPAPLEVVVSRVDESLPGAVLAEDVVAGENVPAFRASIVDGYAVVVPPDGNLRGVFPVVSVSHAAPGDGETRALREGEVARITTGAPLPPGATSVIMVEDTVLRTASEDGREEREVEILAEGVVREGENVREVGSDVREGTTILRRGEHVSAVGGEVGLLASVGAAEVRTYRRPVVGVLSTGDEVVPHDRGGGLRLGEVRDSNRVALLAAAREAGFEALDLGIAADTAPGALEEGLRAGLRAADLVVTTGGVSMGELDLLKPTVERALGGRVHFGRVAMKPGKPTTFATVPVEGGGGAADAKVLFALPGNPASALVTFHLFALPALHRMAGVGDGGEGLPRVRVGLAHDFPLDPARPEYHRAVVSAGADGALTAASTGGQRSSRVGSLRGANALLCLPSGREGPLPKGSRVDALLMGPVRSGLW